MRSWTDEYDLTPGVVYIDEMSDAELTFVGVAEVHDLLELGVPEQVLVFRDAEVRDPLDDSILRDGAASPTLVTYTDRHRRSYEQAGLSLTFIELVEHLREVDEPGGD